MTMPIRGSLHYNYNFTCNEYNQLFAEVLIFIISTCTGRLPFGVHCQANVVSNIRESYNTLGKKLIVLPQSERTKALRMAHHGQ